MRLIVVELLVHFEGQFARYKDVPRLGYMVHCGRGRRARQGEGNGRVLGLFGPAIEAQGTDEGEIVEERCKH